MKILAIWRITFAARSTSGASTCGVEIRDTGYTGKKTCGKKCADRRRVKTWGTALTEDQALEIIDRFRKSGLTFADFCESEGVSQECMRKRLTAAAPDDFSAATEASRLKWHEIYRRGRNFEYKVRRHLISLGYVCMVSPRSEGAADLLAAKSGSIYCVQCKHYSRLRKEEKQPLWDIAAQAGGVPLVAGRCGGQIAFWELKLCSGRLMLRRASP